MVTITPQLIAAFVMYIKRIFFSNVRRATMSQLGFARWQLCLPMTTKCSAAANIDGISVGLLNAALTGRCKKK